MNRHINVKPKGDNKAPSHSQCGTSTCTYDIHKLVSVSATCSNPAKALILFLPIERIFRLLNPFKFAIFSIWLVEIDSCSTWLNALIPGSIFVNGGIYRVHSTYNPVCYFWHIHRKKNWAARPYKHKIQWISCSNISTRSVLEHKSQSRVL